MGALSWQVFDVSELVEAMQDKALGDHIPKAPGVYAWRRKFFVPPGAVTDAEDCSRWIEDLASRPVARLTRRDISPTLATAGLDVGGGGLSAEKLATLAKFRSRRPVREILGQYVEILSELTPPIYIGQTNNFLRRVSQHLSGETGLHSYVHETLGLRWSDLEFRLVKLSATTEISSESRAVQELLEMVAQRALAPFATERSG